MSYTKLNNKDLRYIFGGKFSTDDIENIYNDFKGSDNESLEAIAGGGIALVSLAGFLKQRTVNNKRLYRNVVLDEVKNQLNTLIDVKDRVTKHATGAVNDFKVEFFLVNSNVRESLEPKGNIYGDWSALESRDPEKRMNTENAFKDKFDIIKKVQDAIEDVKDLPIKNLQIESNEQDKIKNVNMTCREFLNSKAFTETRDYSDPGGVIRINYKSGIDREIQGTVSFDVILDNLGANADKKTEFKPMRIISYHEKITAFQKYLLMGTVKKMFSFNELKYMHVVIDELVGQLSKDHISPVDIGEITYFKIDYLLSKSKILDKLKPVDEIEGEYDQIASGNRNAINKMKTEYNIQNKVKEAITETFGEECNVLEIFCDSTRESVKKLAKNDGNKMTYGDFFKSTNFKVKIVDEDVAVTKRISYNIRKTYQEARSQFMVVMNQPLSYGDSKFQFLPKDMEAYQVEGSYLLGKIGSVCKYLSAISFIATGLLAYDWINQNYFQEKKQD